MSAAYFFSLICFLIMILWNSAFDQSFNLDHLKVIGESSFFETKIWTEYSNLLAVEDRNIFCEENRGFGFPDPAVRTLYYRCQNGRKELYQCIEGFEFDNIRLRCLPRDDYLKHHLIQDECFQQMDGFYPDLRSNCQDYFRCKNGIKIEKLQCDPHQSFSFHLQTCQLKSEVTCLQLNCHYENDSFYVFPGSKCQAYYYCRKGIRSDFLCPKGSIFNIKTKNCVESGICYEPICTGRIDGRYADTTHDCNRSFDCKGGAIKEVHGCPQGQKFNGSKCSLLPINSCEKPEKTAAAFYFRADDECKNLNDGSHIIPGTDCRNVRICLRGRTTAAFECPRDQRFNNNWCLPKDDVPCDDVCSMKTDGYYADEFSDCQGYYFCLNGKVIRRKQCPVGTAFNGYMCISSYLVSCPKKSRTPMGRCLGLKDGFHPDYLKGCENYFYCYNHEMVLQGSCSKGKVWSDKQCVEREEGMCEGPKYLKECTDLSPGLYQNKSSACAKYFYCNNGSGTLLSCPQGKIFNGDKCVNADEYTCLNSNDCVDQPDGYRQDKNTGCRSYYFCSNGNKITYVCPEDFIFNGSQCVSSQSYECPFSPSKDCLGKNDGYHPDKQSECKKYFYCFKEEKLNTLICDGKKIFDGQGCVLAENPKSICFGIQHNPCQEKDDGNYADMKSSCRKYFSCKNNKVSDEKWCPQEFGYNGSACVKTFSCSSVNEDNICDGYQIGFHQDLMSNCKNYFLCLGRIKTWASCPRGTIFNGQLCIDSNYYKCPSKKS